MKDEINKIIQSISDFYKLDNALKYYLDRHKAQTLLDYITNLQEENENRISESLSYDLAVARIKELEQKINGLQEERDYLYNKLSSENEHIHDYYKSRNEKAIEYIDNLRDESAEREGFYNCFPDDLYIPNIDELLNILQGGNK